METTSGSVIVIDAVVADCWDAASTPVPRAVSRRSPKAPDRWPRTSGQPKMYVRELIENLSCVGLYLCALVTDH